MDSNSNNSKKIKNNAWPMYLSRRNLDGSIGLMLHGLSNLKAGFHLPVFLQMPLHHIGSTEESALLASHLEMCTIIFKSHFSLQVTFFLTTFAFSLLSIGTAAPSVSS